MKKITILETQKKQLYITCETLIYFLGEDYYREDCRGREVTCSEEVHYSSDIGKSVPQKTYTDNFQAHKNTSNDSNLKYQKKRKEKTSSEISHNKNWSHQGRNGKNAKSFPSQSAYNKYDHNNSSYNSSQTSDNTTKGDPQAQDNTSQDQKINNCDNPGTNCDDTYENNSGNQYLLDEASNMPQNLTLNIYRTEHSSDISTRTTYNKNWSHQGKSGKNPSSWQPQHSRNDTSWHQNNSKHWDNSCGNQANYYDERESQYMPNEASNIQENWNSPKNSVVQEQRHHDDSCKNADSKFKDRFKNEYSSFKYGNQKGDKSERSYGYRGSDSKSRRSMENVDPEYAQFDQWSRDPNVNYNVKELEQDLFEMSEEYSLGHCVAADMRMGSGIAVIFK